MLEISVINDYMPKIKVRSNEAHHKLSHGANFVHGHSQKSDFLLNLIVTAHLRNFRLGQIIADFLVRIISNFDEDVYLIVQR